MGRERRYVCFVGVIGGGGCGSSGGGGGGGGCVSACGLLCLNFVCVWGECVSGVGGVPKNLTKWGLP